MTKQTENDSDSTFSRKEKESMIVCDVCPRACRLEEGEFGFCGVRQNMDGRNVDGLQNLVCTTVANGSLGREFDVFLPGCNLKCGFCMFPMFSRQLDASLLRRTSAVDLFREVEEQESTVVVVSGGEPTLHHEFLRDFLMLQESELRLVMIMSNGYVGTALAEQYADILSRSVYATICVGVKDFAHPRTYRKMGADPHLVLSFMETLVKHNAAFSIMNLVDPSFGPIDEEAEKFAKWAAGLRNRLTSRQIKVSHDPLTVPYLPFSDVWKMPLVSPKAEVKDYLQAAQELFRSAGCWNLRPIPSLSYRLVDVGPLWIQRGRPPMEATKH